MLNPVVGGRNASSVTAIGATVTARGIASKNFLLATTAGQLIAQLDNRVHRRSEGRLREEARSHAVCADVVGLEGVDDGLRGAKSQKGAKGT